MQELPSTLRRRQSRQQQCPRIRTADQQAVATLPAGAVVHPLPRCLPGEKRRAATVAALQPLPDSSDGACRHCPAASSFHTACRRYRAPLPPSLQPGEKRRAATVAACTNRYQSPATAPVATADEQAVATLLVGTIAHPSSPRCSQDEKRGCSGCSAAAASRFQRRRLPPLPSSKQLPHCLPTLSRTPLTPLPVRPEERLLWLRSRIAHNHRTTGKPVEASQVCFRT